MKKVILSGLMVTVPLGITFYAIYLIYNSLNSVSSWLPLPLFPGSGIVYIFLFIFLVGFVSQWWVAKKGLALIELIIGKFPGIKTLYRMSKETLSSLAGDKRAFSQVVLYTEKEDVFRIGFLTSEDVSGFQLGQDYVAVYFPHGLQVSGDIRLLPRDKIVFVDTPVEEALQFCLSAGVASKRHPMEENNGE
ncbi:MAG TPA: DUF502 domain-containing protein [Bacillota bacterium]|nr:DUF502 domain-containing protein [Bacillota bacterium]